MGANAGQPAHNDAVNDRCDRCGEPIGPGTPLCTDRVTLRNERIVCHECAEALRGRVRPVMQRGEVPVTMPNPNLPNTH